MADRDLAIREAVRRYNRDMPRRTAVEFAGDGGAYYLLHGNIINTAESSQDEGIDLTSAGSQDKLAIGFTLTRRQVVREFAFFCQRNDVTVDGELVGELFTDDGAGLPESLIATAVKIDIDDGAGPPEGRYAKVRFYLENAITLPAGDYHAALSSTGYTYANGTDEVVLGVQQGDTPTNNITEYDGATWSAYSTDSAGILEVIGSTPGWEGLRGAPLGVEYPAADLSSDESPVRLDDDTYEIFMSQEGSWLRFRELRPSTSELIRINLAETYIWQEGDAPSIDTPSQDFDALCYLAASKCCMRIANKFGQKHSSTLGADVVDRKSQGEFYRRQGKDYEKEYKVLLGLDKEQEVGASMAILDLDLEPPHSQGFLFHGKRTR